MSEQLKPHADTLPVKIPEYTQTALALTDLNARYRDMVFDVSTAAGLKQAKDARAEIKGFRVDLEKTRTAIKADALEQCRMIDAEARQIKEALEALEIPIDQQIKAEERRKEDERIAKEQAEMARVETIQKSIMDIRAIPSALSGKTSEDIKDALDDLKELRIDDDFAEFTAHAQAAKADAIAALEKMATNAEALEAERAELARLRAEAEQRQREEAARKAEEERRTKEQRDREAVELQEERAKLDRERAEHEARIQAEREEQERQDALKRQEQAAEQKRLADERADIDRRLQAAKDAEEKAEAEKLKAQQEEQQRLEREAEEERIRKEREADAKQNAESIKAHFAFIETQFQAEKLTFNQALQQAYDRGFEEGYEFALTDIEFN